MPKRGRRRFSKKFARKSARKSARKFAPKLWIAPVAYKQKSPHPISWAIREVLDHAEGLSDSAKIKREGLIANASKETKSLAKHLLDMANHDPHKLLIFILESMKKKGLNQKDIIDIYKLYLETH